MSVQGEGRDDLMPTKEEHDSVNADAEGDTVISPSREITNLNIKLKIPETNRFSNLRDRANKNDGRKVNEKETATIFCFKSGLLKYL